MAQLLLQPCQLLAPRCSPRAPCPVVRGVYKGGVGAEPRVSTISWGKPAPSSSSLLEAGFELVNVKQYGGEEQVKLKVVVKIPGS